MGGVQAVSHLSAIPVSHFGSALGWYLVRPGVFLISFMVRLGVFLISFHPWLARHGDYAILVMFIELVYTSSCVPLLFRKQVNNVPPLN
jgi:hypothetical protein